MRLLFEAILTLETVEECNAFFHDICTIQEMKAMKERDMIPAMMSAMGVPAMALGTRQVSRRSRTPAMSRRASRKPAPVAKA